MSYTLFNVMQEGVEGLIETFRKPVRQSGSFLIISGLTPKSLRKDVEGKVANQVEPLIRRSTPGAEPYASLIKAREVYLELPQTFEGCNPQELIASDKLARQYQAYGEKLLKLQAVVSGIVKLAREHGFAA